MALDKPYLNIPGTTVFDADQARKGYHLNQFCMSLMNANNRARFKADEAAYLAQWPMTPAQHQAVLERNYNELIALGGNIYFLAKIFSSDGKSFQHVAALMTGMTQEQYAEVMLKGGRLPHSTLTHSQPAPTAHSQPASTAHSQPAATGEEDQ